MSNSDFLPKSQDSNLQNPDIQEAETLSEKEYKTLVFLVDDQPIVGEAVRRLLKGEKDIALHYCSDASHAVDQAAQINPTVILQDLVLPGIDGLDVVQQLRTNPKTSDIPIIVLSTKEEPTIKSKAFEVGANDYIVKLPDRAELIARLRYHSNAYISQIQRDAAFHALRSSQQKLLESNTSLIALNQQLNEFVGMAAHDLRNPLGLVLGFSKFLIRDNPENYTAQQRKFLTAIQSSAEFMLHLVNDLLDVSKIEAGKLTLSCRPTDLVALVESNISLNRILATEKEIDIKVNADNIPPVVVDAYRVGQVLTNLVTNAIKYSYPRTRVDVDINMNSNNVILAVRDQGQGIPPDEQDRLFTPFGVTSVRATSGEKSTGLGLLIAKKVVDAHGGRIWVESEQGKGSTFYVSLPKDGRGVLAELQTAEL